MIKSITIIGSGRWSKQYILTLLRNKLAKKIEIISKRNLIGIKKWTIKKKFQKYVSVKKAINKKENNFAIVANLASEHYKYTNLLIKKKYNVLVEKPLTINFSDAKKIYENSKKSNVYVAYSNVFLFTSYIKKFSKLITKNKLKNIGFVWHDKFGDVRYGEKIIRDKKIPFCFDILPHIFSILSYFRAKKNKNNFKVFRKLISNNNKANIKFKLNDFNCTCDIKKKAKKRKRIIYAKNSNLNLQIDFSDESSVVLKKNN